MKKRTSNLSRRIVSLLMSMILTLTLVTPAAFATEVVDGSGTTIVAGNTNPADANPNEDTEGKDDVDKNAEDEQQPAEPDDENAEPSEGEDAVNEPSNEADTQEGEGTDTPVVAQRTVTVERYRTDAAYEVKIVVGVEEGVEKLDTTYAIDADTKTVTLKLTKADHAGEPVYIKTALDDVLVTKGKGESPTPALTEATPTLEYALPNEGDVTLYYGTQADFVSAWYTSVTTGSKYTIRSAEELEYFAQLVNNGNAFAGGVVTLARDIDLSAVCGEGIGNWTPIGKYVSSRSKKPFSGTFDGQGHTISGLYINLSNRSGNLYQGLFGYCSGGIVQNLIVTGSVAVTGSTGPSIQYVAGIVGYGANSSAVKNCGFYGTINVANSSGPCTNKNGGVLGHTPSKVNATVNCWFYSVGAESKLDVGAKSANCVKLTATEKMDATKLDILNTKIPETGKQWGWNVGALYPELIDPPKIVTVKQLFPDYKTAASIKVNEDEKSLDKNGAYDVGNDTSVVTIILSGSDDTFYYATSANEKAYGIYNSGAGKLTPITEGYSGKLPATLYYGTKEDFEAAAAWNNALSTNGKSVKIKDAAALKALARMVNSGKVSTRGMTINLNADIDLSGIKDWTPIGTESNPFCGEFIGWYYNNSTRTTSYYTISGLTVDGADNAGLFGVVDGGTIQYVSITDTTKTIENAEKTVSAGTVTGSGNVGSIVGWLRSGTVKKCISTAAVSGGKNVGGLVGLTGDVTEVSNSCYFNAASINTPTVGSGKEATGCFYLAGTSTFGSTVGENGENGDTGAREKIEFEVGRVTYELNGDNLYSWRLDPVAKLPTLQRNGPSVDISQLTLTAEDLPEGATAEIKLGDENTIVLTNGNTQYVYGTDSVRIPMTVESVTQGYQVIFDPSPSKGKLRIGSDYTYKLTAADISWYVGHENDMEYTLTTASQLEGFAILVNGTAEGDVSFKDKTIKLGNDIELTGTWTPIGIASNGHFFEGTFDGQKYTIKGLRVNTDDTYAGLFGYVRYGTIKNLTVEGSVRSTTGNDGANTGGIVGYLYQGTVENCTNKAEVTAVRGNVGGVVGHAYEGNGECRIENCKNNAAVTATGNDVSGTTAGGVVGSAGDKVIVRLCENTGDVTASGAKNVSASGIGGWRVLNSHNSGKVEIASGTADYLYAGGITAQGTVDSCQNGGEVRIEAVWNGGQGFCYAGGITGGGTVTNSYNTAVVANNFTYADSAVKLQSGVAAGIAANPTSSIFNCYNTGDVSSTEGETHGLGGVGVPGVYDSGVENSYYVCKVNSTELMKYVSTAGTENGVVYNETDKTYMVGDKLLVDLLNENGSGGTPWFVNAEKNIILPTFIVLWNSDQHAACTGMKIVYVIYEPGDGICRTATGQPRKDMIVLEADESGTIQQVSYTVLDAETVGVANENGTFQMWSDGSSTYAAGGSITLSGDEGGITLTAQWETIWSGMGTETDPYQISNLADLTALQTQVNGKSFDYGDKWFRLMADIDMKDAGNWTPIGDTYETHFAGSFDGASKTITNLYVSTDGQVAGLFGWATGDQSRIFKDLTLKGTVEHLGSGTGWCGSLIAVAYNGNGRGVTLRDITVDVTVRSHRGTIAGVVGRGVTEAKNCEIYGLVEGGAGLTTTDAGDLMEDCHNHAEIKGTGSAVGLWAGNVKAVDCSNDGAVTATSESYTGSVAGITSGGTVIRCTNSGEIKGNGSMRVNGITISGSAEYCTNTGTVRSEKGSAYGISASGSAEYCKNTGNIHGAVSASGIIGEMSASFCYNLGTVTANNSKQAYGIGGRYVENCFTYNPNSHVALAPVLRGNKEVTAQNSYYLANSKDELLSAGEYATLADFASGKVAWGVDGGEGAHTNYWTQIVGRGQNQMPAGPGRAYPKPIEDPNTEFSVYRALVQYGTGGTASLEANGYSSENQENAVYGMKGTSVAVTATPKDDTFGLKSLTLDLMGTGSTTALESGGSFTLGEANALVVAAFASTGNGGSGDGTGGTGGNGDGTGTDTGDGAGDENDEGLQDGLNLEVEYDVKGLVLAAYGAWGAEGSGKTFQQWLKDSPEVLRALITNSLDNMAVAAMGKKTDEAKDLAALLLASLNEHSGLDGQSSDTIAKMLRRYIESGTEAAFSAWLTTGGGMASGTYESIYAQYTNSLLALADRLYTNWESSGTSLTFPVWLDAQQVTMESLSENAEEPDTEPDDTQTTEAPEDVPDGQEAEGGASGGGNSVWEVIGTVVRENPIIVWSIVAVIAALVIVGAVRRYHKVKRDERDDVTSKK